MATGIRQDSIAPRLMLTMHIEAMITITQAGRTFRRTSMAKVAAPARCVAHSPSRVWISGTPTPANSAWRSPKMVGVNMIATPKKPKNQANRPNMATMRRSLSGRSRMSATMMKAKIP